MAFWYKVPLLLASALVLILVNRNLLQQYMLAYYQMALDINPAAPFHAPIEGERMIRLFPDEMTDSLKMLLDAAFSNKDVWDADVHVQTERERCKRYNLKYNNRTTRRRIFWGSLVADDSWHVLGIAAMEAYGIFDTVALVESNTTQMLYPRKIRFGPDSERLRILRQPVFWGPHTRVSVDYYYDDPTTKGESRPTELWRENLQRDMILERWKHNGMKDDDIGYLSDLDEVATRDFLRALQICDVPQFRPGQDCKKAKVIASTIVFEGSPMCLQKGRRWYHPDMVIGECVDKIGDDKIHKPVPRLLDKYGTQSRIKNWKKINKKMGPLWDATDFRMLGGSEIQGRNGEHTAYHFHNFFESIAVLRNKYLTYGHPTEGALEKPLGELHSDDVGFMVDCLMDRTEKDNEFKRAPGGWKSLGKERIPIAFKHVSLYPEMRHLEFQQMMAADEKLHPPNRTIEHPPKDSAKEVKTHQRKRVTKHAHSKEVSLTDKERVKNKLSRKEGKEKKTIPVKQWDPAKCVVIGLAVGYPLEVFETFVGSLRATGYPGHIILGIATDTDQQTRDYLAKRNVTMKEVPLAEHCTYHNYTTVDDTPSTEQICAKAYPDYKIQWGRFPLAADWLRECKDCTDGVMLTDTRDAYFQADPFQAVTTPHSIMVFEETPKLTTENWLTDIPVLKCKNFKFGPRPMLCSGSTMGTRQGILNYVDAMVREFDLWKVDKKCRSDMVGDDQSIHNYLFYTNQLPGAVAIPHRTGSIHVVGFEADLIFRAAIQKAKKAGNDEGWVNSHRFYGTEKKWRNWLSPKYNLTDRNTGFITNLDGSPSPQVHQFDRFGLSFPGFWLDRMTKEWNKKLDDSYRRPKRHHKHNKSKRKRRSSFPDEERNSSHKR